MKKLLLLGLSLCFLISCVSTSAVRLGGTATRPAVTWDKVAVYRTADQVPGKYEEIGLLVSTGASGWTTEGGMWKSMQKKAGQMGANGIILDAISEPKAGTKVIAAALGLSTERKGKAVAIYVFPPENK
jgi:hypothetical protein